MNGFLRKPVTGDELAGRHRSADVAGERERHAGRSRPWCFCPRRYWAGCAELVHGVDQHAHVLRIHVRRHAVAEVEDVAVARRRSCPASRCDFGADRVG